MRQQQVPVKAFWVVAFAAIVALLASSCGTSSNGNPDASGADAAPNPCGGNNFKQCNGVCIDVQNDFQNCGDCGNACPSNEVCSHGTCAVVCGGGTSRCGNGCVDLKSDPNNCGGCNTKCPSGEVCNKTACALTCQAGLTNCNSACVDTTNDDANCGGCGAACSTGEQCVNSACQATCQTGWSSCPSGDGGTTCVDTQSDPNNCNGCNQKCTNGYFCSQGTCGLNCAGGTTLCNNTCVDESIDPNHCGACGTVCGAGNTCSSAHCCANATPYYCGKCDTFANCVLKSGGHIAAGYEHTCAINTSGGVYCWGYNGYGNIGNSSSTFDFTTAQAVTGLSSGVATIGLGEYHSCAVTNGGQAYCWGAGFDAQLGNNTTASSTFPVAVSGITTTGSRIGGTYDASCALLTNGAVDCWGYDGNYEMGGGTAPTFSYIKTPAATLIASGAVALSQSAIGYTYCAVLSSGATKCWGENSYGLGDGVSTTTSTPVTVSGVSTALLVSTSGSHTCVVLSGGALQCWGYNFYGQLGNGGSTTSSTPVTTTIANVVAVATGEYHTCVLTAGGAVECIGYNVYGQLGNGTTSSSPTTTWQTAIASGAIGVAAGAYHSCALLTSGKAYCWGYNGDGQLGDGTTTQRSTPVLVSGF